MEPRTRGPEHGPPPAESLERQVAELQAEVAELHEAFDESPGARAETAGVSGPSEPTEATAPAVATDARPATTDADTSTDELVGSPLGQYSIGDPGRAAREVISTMPLNPADPADTQLDGGTAGDLIIRAASSRGIAHRHDRTPRQDDYAICATDRWLIVAVADGVSAGALSHQAATLACRGAAAAVRDDLESSNDPAVVRWDEMLSAVARRIVAHGRRVLASDEREAESISPKDVANAMATTLAIAAVGLEPTEQSVYEAAVVTIGDTSAFVLDGASGWTPVTAVKNEGAAVASSATVALPYVPTEAVSPIGVEISGGGALMLMSDGVGDPLGRGDGPVGRHLAGLWAEPPDPLTFAAQISFARKSFDDDRTVVGIWTPR